QVGRGRRTRVHLRRADPRRGRRREGRDLQPDEPPHRARRGHHHDFVGAAGAARDERSRPRHAQRADSGGAGPGGGDGRTRAERGTGVSQLRSARQFGTLIGLVALSVTLWILTPHFLTVSNLLNVVEQTSINAIVAVGMTFVILSGGIDLSVGSLVALSGVVLGTGLQSGQPIAVALALAVATGTACGLVN